MIRMAYPQDALAPGEELLWFSRRHWRTLLGSVLILLAVAVVSGVLLAVANGNQTIQWLAFGLFVAGALWFVVSPFLQWLTATYTVTSRRILTRSGLVKQSGRDIPLQRVSGVSFEKGIVDRMVGCGTLLVESSAESTSIVFHDVPDVERVQRMLTELISTDDVD